MRANLPPDTVFLRVKPPNTTEQPVAGPSKPLSESTQPGNTAKENIPPGGSGKLTIKIPARPDEEEERVFCPSDLRQRVIDLMETHFCAHPLIPGYAPPNPAGIRRWAVKQMYDHCVDNDLPELWAYLWENWYRNGRWELWARAPHPQIPKLKTTMMVESHWRRIKKDFLHHFNMPRVDLLVWILIKKLGPTYDRKLDHFLQDTGRFRELPSWRKDFKADWRKKEKTPITTDPDRLDKYRTQPAKWVCTCPDLPKSRFLICKHLVQGVKPVSPVFFLEVQRNRTAPFWSHPSLIPLGC
ncbi:hypothetical protein C8R46DRAFT_885355 [Mycena filopes]|nr:hypothetical protein C8R46DRAFT_885355 [Mycena filopes]